MFLIDLFLESDYSLLGSMVSEKLLAPREAAEFLGVSYSTLKLWIYKGKIHTIKTAGGHHRVPESQLDKFLYRIHKKSDIGSRRADFRRVSASHQLICRVTDIKTSGLIAQVSLSLGGQRISIITVDAVREKCFHRGVGGSSKNINVRASFGVLHEVTQHHQRPLVRGSLDIQARNGVEQTERLKNIGPFSSAVCTFRAEWESALRSRGSRVG